jgi:hypothetical protein
MESREGESNEGKNLGSTEKAGDLREKSKKGAAREPFLIFR